MNRRARALLSALIAAAVLLAPNAAAASDSNYATAVNQTDGAALVAASVQYRVAPNGVVDEENVAQAAAQCFDCQTLAVAYQLVLVTREFRTFVPHNDGTALNVLCDSCLTVASAKQIIIVTDGPATLTGNGHIRMQALEDRLLALQADLPYLTPDTLLGQLNAAFGEMFDIASTEVVYHDGAPAHAEVAAVNEA